MRSIDVVAGILERDGLLLLAQRDGSRDQPGRWEFPGGKVEPGESQPQALARELAEELGIEAEVGEYVASECWQQGDREIRLHAWRVPVWHGTLRLSCHQALAWVTPEQAAHYDLPPADIPLLAAWRAHTGR